MERNLQVKEMLQNKAREEESQLRREVILSILREGEDYMAFMEDVVNYGCSSGVVSSLIRNCECKEFISKHMEEVFDMYNELDNKFALEISELAWSTYERICMDLLGTIDYELEELE